MENEISDLAMEEFVASMKKAARRQLWRMVLPVLIGVIILSFIIGFVLGAIIF